MSAAGSRPFPHAILLAATLLLPSIYAPWFFDPETPRFLVLLVAALAVVLPACRAGLPLSSAAAITLALGLLLAAVAVPLSLAAARATGIPAHGLPDFLRILVLPLGLFAGVAATVPAGRRRGVMTALALAPALVLVLGWIHQWVIAFPGLPRHPGGRFTATLLNTNRVGEVALAGLAPAILLFATARDRDGRPRPLLALPLMAAVLLLAVSRARASFAGAAVTLATAAVLLRVRPPRAVVMTLAAMAAMALATVAVMAPARRATLDLVRHAASAFDPATPSRVVRVDLLATSMDMLRARPLTGHGAGSFQAACPPFRRSREWGLHGAASLPEHAHSEPANLAAELGIPGLVLGVAFALSVFAGARRRLTAAPPEERPVVAAALAGLAGLCAASLLSYTFHDPPPLFAAAVLGGLALCGGPPRPRPLLRFGLVTLGSVTVLLALADATFDLRTGLNVRAWNRAGRALQRGDAPAAAAELRDLHPSLDAALREPLRDPGRLYRTALYMDEAWRVRALMGRNVLPRPDVADVRGAWERVLATSPFHVPAIQSLVEFDFTEGRNAEADFRLADAAHQIPLAPGISGRIGSIARILGRHDEALRHLAREADLYPDLPGTEEIRRRLILTLIDEGRIAEAGRRAASDIDRHGATLARCALAGQVALARSEDSETTGLFSLDGPADPPSPPHRTPGTGDREFADVLLARLHEHPDELATLELLAEILGKLVVESRRSGERPDEMFFEDEANRARAMARARIRYALDFLAAGDTESALARLREALRLRPRLGDAWFLRVLILLRRGETAQAAEEARSFGARGFDVEGILARHPETREPAGDAAFRSVLRGPEPK